MITALTRGLKIHFRWRNAGMWLMLVLLTLPHFKPAYFDEFPNIETVINAWRMASFMFCVFWLLLKRRVSHVVIIAGVWESFLLLSTIINHGPVYNLAVIAFSVISIVLLYDLAYKEGSVFLSSQVFCFGLIVLTNLLTEFLYPNGMYWNKQFPWGPNWFLGYYNVYTKWYIPAIMFAWLYIEETGKKKMAYFLIGCVIISALKVYAGGLTLVLAGMFGVYLFFKNITSIFNYYSYWLLHVLFICGFLLCDVQSTFSWFIGGVLGKMGSLMERIYLWNRTLTMIAESPIIGHGVQDVSVRLTQYGVGYGIHAHNLILELLYQGGAIGLALWFFLVIVSGYGLYRNRNQTESKIVATAFLGWCIVTLGEPYTSPFLMGMFVIAYRSGHQTDEISLS